MDKIIKAAIKINNMPENISESGYMVVTLDHGQVRYYGMYEDDKHAQMTVNDFDNKFLIKI